VQTHPRGAEELLYDRLLEGRNPLWAKHLGNGITFHDIRRTVKTNMLIAGVDKVHRDIILGHSLQGMDVHYMSPSIEDLHRAMAEYTEWFDDKLAFKKEAKPI